MMVENPQVKFNPRKALLPYSFTFSRVFSASIYTFVLESRLIQQILSLIMFDAVVGSAKNLTLSSEIGVFFYYSVTQALNF